MLMALAGGFFPGWVEILLADLGAGLEQKNRQTVGRQFLGGKGRAAPEPITSASYIFSDMSFKT